MIRVVGRSAYLEARRPLVYLDHCAMREVSTQLVAGGRLLSRINRLGGELLISLLHLLETGRVRGDSFRRLHGFLAALGPHWVPLDIDPWRSVKTQESDGSWHFPFLPWLATAVPLDHKSSLAPALLVTQSPAFREAVSFADNKSRDAIAEMERLRAAYKRGDAKVELQKSSKVTPEIALETIRAHTVRENFRWNRNHLEDMFHTIVPLSVADVLVLDGHWAATARRYPTYGQVFEVKRLNDALDLLDARWPLEAPPADAPDYALGVALRLRGTG